MKTFFTAPEWVARSGAGIFYQHSTHLTMEYYSGGRRDRSGAQIHDMLLAKAYCMKHDYKYVGCPTDTSTTRSLLHYLNIGNTYNDVGSDIISRHHHAQSTFLRPELYRKDDSDIFTPDIRNEIISNFDYEFGNAFTITVHIRRGDVTPQAYPTRYLYNEYYMRMLKKVLAQLKEHDVKDVVINICSESKSFEAIDEFKGLTSTCKVNLLLDTELRSVYKLMIHADVLILSRSSFSFVPAFYNKRCVIYHPFWHKRLNHWLDSTDEDFDAQLVGQISSIVKKHHS